MPSDTIDWSSTFTRMFLSFSALSQPCANACNVALLAAQPKGNVDGSKSD